MITLNTGITPAGMAITCDSRYLYVANNNNYSIANQDSVTVIDLKKKKVITTIHDSSFDGPYTITIKKNKAYVTNSGGSTITIIDVKTNTVFGLISGFDGPSGMVIKRNKAYVNNYGATPGVGSGNGNWINVVDLDKNIIIGSRIIVGLAPAALSMSSDGRYVYTANYRTGETNSGTISKIDTKTNSVVTTIGPFSSNGLSGPFAIKLSSDNSKAYVTNFGSNNFEPFGTTLSILDLENNTIIKNIELGIQPSGLALSKDERYAYVSNYNTLYAYVQLTPPPPQYLNLTPGQGTINIIDLKHGSICETIPVNQSPSYIVLSPNEEYLCVSNYTSNTVNIFENF